jgi:hypothetical protein
MEQAIELVVDATSPRLRAISGYARRLRGPIIDALRSIDGMVDRIPGVICCRRETFIADPRVNAFFVSPDNLQQVFSRSKEIRELFGANADADRCYALMCMHRQERSQLGMSIEDDMLRKDVMQTSVSFTDHELVSPGLGEDDARAALKCSIFTSLVGHIRRQATDSHHRSQGLQARARALRARLNRAGGSDAQHDALASELREIDAEMQALQPKVDSLPDQFRFVLDALASPQDIIGIRNHSIYIDRFGIKHDRLGAPYVRELPLTEIHVDGQRPRIASLVSFPRNELLPKRDFLQEASLFLVP